MKIYFRFLVALLLLHADSSAQEPVLIGYWQNWMSVEAPYIPLDQIDGRYDIICVSFAVPTSPSDMTMQFVPESVSQSTFILQMSALQTQGKKVLLSIGGANASISMPDVNSRDAFVNSMNALLDTYPFDGIDIDIEHGNSILASGTINNPTATDCIHLIDAITQIKAHYASSHAHTMMLTCAPETAYVQGGMSAYGGIWGGYLPLLDALRNDINFLHVQLYNSGSVYGIDGGIYTQGTADFIVALTEALIQGFPTAGGTFEGFPQEKVCVGLPACGSAAGGGYCTPLVVEAAIDYLRGTGSQPGSYSLNQSSGYPNLGGMMTWSVNWDAVSTCNDASYAFAQNFETVFGSVLALENSGALGISRAVYPNPATDYIQLPGTYSGLYQVMDISGKIIQSGVCEKNEPIEISSLATGSYWLNTEKENYRFMKLCN